MAKPTVIVLTTGGTIGHRSEANGVATMSFDPAGLVSALALPDVDIEFRAVMRKGSMDVGPADWVVIAKAVSDAMASAPRGVVIAHGTDTMHYTAAALAFMLRGLPVPVVMTGSMIPGGDAGSDALPNLRDAVTVAALADLAEVCVVFKGQIIRGTRARKVHSHAVDAFTSINVPPIGTVEAGRIALGTQKVARRSASTLNVTTALDTNVVLIKLTPNLSKEALARQLDSASGAVLEGTGVGHIAAELRPAVAAFGKPVVVTTQAVHGGEKLGIYEVDKDILAIPNIIPAGDMSSETALVKLMWALPQRGDVKALMRTNIAGEIG
ncbi:asparaginase [Rhodoplanes sp. Z2-YC6860]|uniref:asparaginase n=1 Tax=Rhodoplanes sp. Z2-YC6860 TaxID=674703 RepID=UPI00078E1D19|nr:asparaginase [Rhodoplanes sp. Z2-YC6860]AMN41177.1 L-asparaginase [Rhodoplanes sp. Z2-YC6860]